MLTSPPRTGPAARVLDPAALGQHLDRLMRAALAMCGSRADAEDLVQEVCLRVLAKPRVVRGSDIGYLHGVLRNTFISDYQTRLRRRTTPVEPASLSHVRAGLRDDPELRAQHQEVRDAVSAVDVLGLHYAEAAETLGVADGTIMSRLYRGRAAVAERVGAPGALAA